MNQFTVTFHATCWRVMNGKHANVGESVLKGTTNIDTELPFEQINTAEYAQEVGDACLRALRAEQRYKRGGWKVQSIAFTIHKPE